MREFLFRTISFGLLFVSTAVLSVAPAAAQDANAPDNESGSIDLSKTCDILIVTDESLADSWNKFATWKTTTGRPAKIVTTQEIEESFEGTDIQAKIRLCCLKHIDEMNTKWVILGGDSSGDGGLVPDRDTDHSDCRMLPYDNIPTDLYYISETDWDANDDGRYGVFKDDLEEVSYYNPKSTIGRIPVRTPADVLAYTEKVIEYESMYPYGNFAHRMVYTCPEETALPKIGTSIKDVSSVWSEGRIDRFFADETPWDDYTKGDHELTPDNFVNMINQRRASKIHVHGHGLLNLWLLEHNQTVQKESVAEMTNQRAYPIMTTVSCLTGQYDNQQDPCITESMLRQPKGGAIAILAPSREGVPFMMDPRDFQLMMTEGKMDGTTGSYTKFWQHALSGEGTIGEAFRRVKMDMESNARKNDGFHMCQCELNLLGDPSLYVYSAPPESLEKARISRSGTQLSIRRAPSETKVCIWDGEQQYMVESTDTNGRLTFDLDSDADRYHVALMKQGYNTRVQKAISLKETANIDTAKDDGNSKTLDEFKQYAKDRVVGVSDEQLSRFAKAVDKNDDGKISTEEFEDRRAVLEQIMSEDTN